MIVTVLQAIFWLCLTYCAGYGLLWLGVKLYVIWYMANGGL